MSSNDLDFCRLCFREDGNISVFEYECGDDSWTLADRIFECVSVKISQEDKLPHTVCEPCLQFIIRWCDFKTTCDRNQRTWFLWLKSLNLGSPKEIQEGLADNARKKCIELGYRSPSISSPEKGAFHPYNVKSPLPGILKPTCDEDSDVVIQEEEDIIDNRSNNEKGLKIESTQSLVDYYDKDKVESQHQKLTNGVLLIDSDNSDPCSEKNENQTLQQGPTGDNIPGEGDNIAERVSQEPPSLQNSSVNRSLFHESDDSSRPKEVIENITPQEQVNQLPVAEINDNDFESTDKEVENAFNQENNAIVDDDEDAIPDREMALLNGDDPPFESLTVDEDTAEPVVEAETGPKPVNNVVKSLLGPPKRNSALFSRSVLKARLMMQDDGNEVRRKSPIQQPRRPDTPYPHEILKNMTAKLSENCSMGQMLPHSAVSLPPGPVSFTAPGPVNSGPEVTLKPVSLLHLIGKPHPPSSSSERMSESSVSDSASSNKLHFGVRIKQELMSDDGESEEDAESTYNNISIKMEPMEYLQHPIEEVEASDQPPLDPNCTYCSLCRKRFSAHQQLLRHMETSQLHKRVSSFAALGHKIDCKVIAQLNREVRSQAYFRAFAKKKMIAMERGIGEGGTSTPKVARQTDHNLLECKICNIVLPSRSHKLKHDNSKSHQLNVDALMNKEVGITVTEEVVPLVPASQSPHVPVQGSSSVQATTYTCPFASCSAIFGDGGQLIVHMHTHGISLPIHETNKQIQLSQERTQLNQVTNQHGQQQNQFNQKQNQQQNNFSQELNQFNQQPNQLTNKPKKMSSRVVKTEVPSGNGKFTCRRCNRSFLKGMALSNHMRYCRAPVNRTTGPPLEKCPICLVPQKNKRCLSYHVKMYHPEEAASILIPPEDYIPEPQNFPCPTCNKPFRTKMSLNSHVHKVHRKIPAECKICHKMFSSRSNLSVHYKIHLNMKCGEYLCHVCFQIFKSRRASYLHKKAGCSLKIKFFSCTECTYTFRDQEALDKHKVENHPDCVEPEPEEPAPVDTSCLDDLNNTACNLCDKIYSSYHNLKRHFKERHINTPKEVAGDKGRVGTISDTSSPLPSTRMADKSGPNESPIINYAGIDPEKDVQCMYCDHMFTTRKSMIHHMRNSCRFVPPKEKCRSCKAERWPWFIGPCKECGKDMNVRVIKRSTSISEPPSKRPRLSESVSTPQSLIAEPANELSKTPLINLKKSVKKPREFLYKCPIGKRSFLSQKTMFSHSASCNGTCKDQAVYCKICHQLYQNPKIYIKHKPCTGKKKAQVASDSLKNQDASKKFVCEFCPVRFKTRSYCCKHMRTVHNHFIRLKKFKNDGVRNVRIKTRSVEAVSETADVSAIDSSTPAMLTHQERIENDQNDEVTSTSRNSEIPPGETFCNGCLKSFASHEALVQHFKNFHKNKFTKVDCTFCSKSIFKRELYEHGFNCIRDQLSNINTLECVVCSTIFYSADEEDTISLKLQEHIMNCCGKLSAGKGEKFKNREKFLCLKCCMLFSSKKSLYAHSYKSHGILVQTSPPQPKSNPPKDSVSDNLVASEEISSQVSSRLSVNPEPEPSTIQPATSLYKCSRCYKTFRTQKGLKCHRSVAHAYQSRKKIKNKKLMKCKFCQRQFYNELKLRNHEKVHGIVKEIVMTEGEDVKHEVDLPSSPLPVPELDQPNHKLSIGEIIGVL